MDRREVTVIVEIGPSGLLSTVLESRQFHGRFKLVQTMSNKRCFPVDDKTLPCLNDCPQIVKAIGKLWAIGFPINFQALFGPVDQTEIDFELLRKHSNFEEIVYDLREFNGDWPGKRITAVDLPNVQSNLGPNGDQI